MRSSMKAAAILLVSLCACSRTEPPPLAEKSSPSTAKVSLELSTPDKALKSYWAVRDSVRAKHHELLAQARSNFTDAEAQMAAVTEGALAKELSTRIDRTETFSRDILDVKVESESRAVVTALIKNSTPIPAGGEVSKYTEELRTNGERYRYILEKNQAGWRVSEIWQWETYPTKDWKKFRPTDGKPYVPALTYEGT